MAGWRQYQAMTTIAKKVGGPFVLGAIVLGAGVLLGNSDRIAKKSKKIILKPKKTVTQPNRDIDNTFHVNDVININENTEFNKIIMYKSEEYIILNELGDGYLIAKFDSEQKNPFVIPKSFIDNEIKHKHMKKLTSA